MATTINAANLSIGMDISKLKQGMGASRAEISQLQGMMRDAQSPTERYTQKLQLLERALHSGAITSEQFRRAQEALANKFKINATEVNSFTGSLVGLVPQITIAAAAYKAFRIVQEGFQLAAAKEQVLAQFEVLTGSVEVTKRLVSDFERLDKASPINVSAFQEASKVLLGFGMSTSQITPTLDRLSEISMGNEEKFRSLALAFGQVSANGRLMGQEVLQMINAGFNPLQEISRTTGVSMAELKKQMEAGAVSVEMVAEAFRSATGQGGRFNDMNEKMATTTAVKMSKLANEWQMFKRSLGEEVRPGINNALDAITGTIESARSFGPWFDEFWATATGNANEFYAARQRGLQIEQELQSNLERENKQLEESKRLAKERADIEAAAARDQEAREAAAKKRDDSEREAFARRGQQEFEKMQRATMGGAEFERRQILAPNFQMTEAERIQAAETLDNMAETQRRKALERLQIEGSIANVQKVQAQAQQAEQQRLADRIAEVKRQTSDRPDLQKTFIDRAKRDSEFRVQEINNAANQAMNKLDAQNRLGQMDKNREKLEQERQRILGATGPNVAATIAPAIKAGTVEAYKAVNQQNEQRAARAEQVAELKRINASLDKLNSERNVVLTRVR